MAAIRKALLGLGLFAALLIVGSASASYLVTVDTSNLSGPGALAFDLIDGDLVPSSTTVTISSFSPVGSLGTATLRGVSAPDLSTTVTFSDTDGYNEYLQQITLGSMLSFVLDVTGPIGDFHDALSFFITDSTGTDLLVSTAGPGSALLFWDLGITNTRQPEVYPGTVIGDDSLPVAIDATAVPEPDVLALVSAALLALALARFAGKGRTGRRSGA